LPIPLSGGITKVKKKYQKQKGGDVPRTGF